MRNTYVLSLLLGAGALAACEPQTQALPFAAEVDSATQVIPASGGNSQIALNHDYGYDAALFVGYDLGAFRIEAEVAYKRARVDDIETSVRFPGFAGAPGAVITPDIFPALQATASDRTGEIQLTNGMRRLLEQRPLYACEIAGVRHDAGHKLGFLKATAYFALRRPEFAEAFRRYLDTLDKPIGTTG